MLGLLVAIILMVFLAYVPGFLVLRSIRCSRFVSACFAPVLSTLGFVALGVILFRVGVFADWASACIPVFGFGFAFLAIGVLIGKNHVGWNHAGQGRCGLFGRPIDRKMLFAALGFNLLIGSVVFLGTLDGPDSFSQNYDMGHHLSQVMAMVQCGNWSTLNVTIDGVNVGGFYPSVLHVYAALLVSALGVSTACAINAVLFVLFAVVFPFGMFALGVLVLPGDRISPFCCAAFSLVFPAFPWMLIRFSALLANVAGFSLMPLAIALFVATFDRSLARADRLLRFLLCVFAMGVISIAHPNTLFSAAVFLVPFCVQRIWDRASEDDLVSQRAVLRWVLPAAFLIVCALLWKIVHDLDAFKGVVEYAYTAKSSLPDAVAGVLFLRFRWFSANIPLAFLVLCGIVSALRTKGCRWLVAAYLFAAVQLVACSSLDPCPLKSYLCGFWYNHDFRLMASFAIFAMPLAGFGLARSAHVLESVLLRSRGNGCGTDGDVSGDHGNNMDKVSLDIETAAQKASGGLCERFFGASPTCVFAVGLALVLVCFPIGFSPSEGVCTRSLGQAMSKLYAINDWEGGFTIYHAEEREFVQQACGLVPEGAVVMNIPYDGSAYAYGLDGLNTYFKSNATYSEEGDAEFIVETRLCDISWDPEVQQAVKELGIEYVIQLDHGFGEGSSTLTREYSAADWRGIDSIDGGVEGFEEVLAEGDMRLDRIK